MHSSPCAALPRPHKVVVALSQWGPLDHTQAWSAHVHHSCGWLRLQFSCMQFSGCNSRFTGQQWWPVKEQSKDVLGVAPPYLQVHRHTLWLVSKLRSYPPTFDSRLVVKRGTGDIYLLNSTHMNTFSWTGIQLMLNTSASNRSLEDCPFWGGSQEIHNPVISLPIIFTTLVLLTVLCFLSASRGPAVE